MLLHRKSIVRCLSLSVGASLISIFSYADVIVVPVERTATLPDGVGSGDRVVTFVEGLEFLLSPEQYFPEIGGGVCLSCPPPFVDLLDVPERIFDHLVLPPGFEMSVEEDPTPTPTLDDPDAINLRLTYFGDSVIGPAKLGLIKFLDSVMPPEIAALRFVGYGYDKNLQNMAPNVGVVKFSNSIGDFDDNGVLNVKDIEELSNVIRHGNDVSRFDLNQDKQVDKNDLKTWIEDLRRSYVGDANLDDVFDSQDMVTIFQAGEYEDDFVGNSTWATGDWTGDGEFDSTDLIAAFQSGGFEQGIVQVANVPEPSTTCLTLLAVAGLAVRWRTT